MIVLPALDPVTSWNTNLLRTDDEAVFWWILALLSHVVGDSILDEPLDQFERSVRFRLSSAPCRWSS